MSKLIKTINFLKLIKKLISLAIEAQISNVFFGILITRRYLVT